MTSQVLHTIREYLEKQHLSKEEVEWLLQHREEVLEYASRQFIVSADYVRDPPSEQARQGWRVLESILEGQREEQAEIIDMKTKRHHWWWYAAAAVILIFASIFYMEEKHPVEQMVIKNRIDRPPGSNIATLQLSNGTIIQLDSTSSGMVAMDGAASITKTADGEIAYAQEGQKTGDLVYNTLRTPMGGQHRLRLPDGTMVWLNAGSSITYPLSYLPEERRVKVKGELYFEVAKRIDQPFIVEMGQAEVRVLGTSFNISNYDNEQRLSTTLLEGAVQISRRSEEDKAGSLLLRPGQQAVIGKNTDTGIQVKAVEDLQQIIAWKNGLFNFEGADLKSVMRQLERWYDIEVRYSDSVENVTFKGKLYRNTNLADVLDVLALMDVKFKMEGNILYVN